MRGSTWALGAAGLTAVGLTVLVSLSFDGAHDGRVAGNEAMVLSGSWGLFGLTCALAARRTGVVELRAAARILSAGALLYLVMGAFLGNARWAEPWARYFGYGGTILASLAAEYILAPDEPAGDVGGLLAGMAAVVGFGACAFEVARFLEPLFRLPMGQPLTPALEAEQDSIRLFWTVAVWSVYSLAVMAVGAGLRLKGARLLATALLGVTLLYAAVFGLPNLAAPPVLRTGALVTLGVSAACAAVLSRAAPGSRDRRESLTVYAATAMAAGIGVAGILMG